MATMGDPLTDKELIMVSTALLQLTLSCEYSITGEVTTIFEKLGVKERFPFLVDLTALAVQPNEGAFLIDFLSKQPNTPDNGQK